MAARKFVLQHALKRKPHAHALTTPAHLDTTSFALTKNPQGKIRVIGPQGKKFRQTPGIVGGVLFKSAAQNQPKKPKSFHIPVTFLNQKKIKVDFK